MLSTLSDIDTWKFIADAGTAVAVIFVTIRLTSSSAIERREEREHRHQTAQANNATLMSMQAAFANELQKLHERADRNSEQEGARNQRNLELVLQAHERATTLIADKIERVATAIGEQHVEAMTKLERACALLDRGGSGYRGPPPPT